MNAKTVERISKALGDPHRIKILQSVKEHENCIQCADIIEIIGLAQSTVSHHIKQLTDAGLLLAQKEGRNVKYSLDKQVFGEYTQFLEAFRI